nr:PAS domain-containing protein [Methylomonas koyamae]
MAWKNQAELYRQDDRQVMQSGVARLNYEEPQTTPSGETIWLRTSKLPLRDSEQQVIGLLGIYEDITAFKASQDALAETVSTLQATLEATADGILVVSLEGRIRSFNQRLLELWQIPDGLIRIGDDGAELLRFLIAQLKDPEYYLNQFHEMVSHPERESSALLEFKDGRLLERYSRPQKIGDKVIGRVWCYSDVTERRRLEQQLLWRTAFLEALLESTPDASSQSTATAGKFCKTGAYPKSGACRPKSPNKRPRCRNGISPATKSPTPNSWTTVLRKSRLTRTYPANTKSSCSTAVFWNCTPPRFQTITPVIWAGSGSSATLPQPAKQSVPYAAKNITSAPCSTIFRMRSG